MAWLLDAIGQAAQGDWEGAANTVSDGLSDTADAAADAFGSAVDSAADSFGFGSGSSGGAGSKGNQGGGLVDEILGALDDASGGFLSRTGDQMQSAFQAAGAAASDTIDQVGKTARDIAEGVGRAADTATGGKAGETVDHLVDAGKAALAGDFEDAARSGQAAFQSGARGAGTAAGKALDAVSEVAERTAEEVGKTAGDVAAGLAEISPAHVANTLSGGMLEEGVVNLGDAARAVADGDFDRAAEKGAAAADALAQGAANVVEAVDEASGGRLTELQEAAQAAGAGVADGDLDAVLDAGVDALDAVSPGRVIADIDEALGNPIKDAARAVGDGLRKAGDEAGPMIDGLVNAGMELVDEVSGSMTPGGLVESMTENPEAWEEIGSVVDDLRRAADKALEGDFEGALDLAASAGETLGGAVSDLGDFAEEVVDTAMKLTPGYAAETFLDLIDTANAQANDASQMVEEDPAAAEVAAEEAAVAYTEVTARLGLATAVSVDNAAGGALADVVAGVEQAEAELADGRYDDALTRLDSVAVDLGRVATAISPDHDIERLAERVAEAGPTDPVRAEGHEKLGAVVDAVARRLPATRTSSDPEEGGEVAGGVTSVASPAIDALTDGHLPRAAAAIRRAVSVDVDPDEVADAVQEATEHLRATGPTVATSVVAVVDFDADGHLGDTAGMATNAVRALREGDYEEAAAIAPRLAERHAAAMDEADIEVPINDLTEGHAETALRYLDEARILDALGDTEAAMERAVGAADEYEAAVACYDRHIEKAVTEAAGPHVDAPVGARVAEALDSTCGGALTRARDCLARGAVDARAGDVASAADAGREANGAMNLARAVYTQPDAPTRLVAEVRRAVDEGEPSVNGGDFGRGALRDVVDESPEEPQMDLSVLDEADVHTVDDPERHEYEPALDGEPLLAGHHPSELVASLDGSIPESTLAELDTGPLDAEPFRSDFDLD